MDPSYRTQGYDSTASRWRAVFQRDPAAHCSFLYGVKTTKIYCRPNCTARVARRANVTYFDTKELAKQAGFRPCVKCKPDDVAFIGQREEIVLKTLDLIWINKNETLMKSRLAALAKDMGLSPSYLARVFKKTMGCTVGEYCRQFEAQGDALGTANAAQLMGAVDDGQLEKTGLPEAVPEQWLVPLSTPGLSSLPHLTAIEDVHDPYFEIDDWLCMDPDLDSFPAVDLNQQTTNAMSASLAQ